MTSDLWKTKLAAWLHDPAEKALVLLRDKTGHEWGTVARLRETLGIPYGLAPRKADWYAAAADRPQWPRSESDGRYAAWCQVDFAERPALIHPLTGQKYKLEKLIDLDPDRQETDIEYLKEVSEAHFRSLVVKDAEGKPDLRRTFLAYWRFGPEAPVSPLNLVWQNLPADTRVPDHSIWAHLDLVSGFTGAMTADPDGTAALLAVSFGPVQGFISEARTTSDLWAGSHLLARIVWEGMRVICEDLGPDAVLFPNLRAVPLVDAWLYQELQGHAELEQRFERMDWYRQKSDANPLFAAALPNRFVALVPADQIAAIADNITRRVRGWVQRLGERTLRRLLIEIKEIQAVDEPFPDDLPGMAQLAEQLEGFPEVHWAAVPWSLAEGAEGGGKRPADDSRLKTALSGFYPRGEKIGFLDSEAWTVLQAEIELDGATFYEPNPGVLYTALYDLLDRLSAAAKSARPFGQTRQEGYRSTLNGEREWLTLDRSHLELPAGQRGNEAAGSQTTTLWTRLNKAHPGWAKKGEHLDAFSAIKRMWPTLITEEVRQILGVDVRRYVVSTHTLALAVSLERWLEETPRPAIPPKLRNLLEATNAEQAALPRRLFDKLRDDADAELLCRKLPGVLDALAEADDVQADEMGRCAQAEMQLLFGDKPETYYAVILFDGDRMGAWLSGGEEVHQLAYSDCWHEQIRASVNNRFGSNAALQAYLHENRAPSPARHRAISEALNHFSLTTARFVVEDCFKGKLVYAGGDDVLAFVCVDDLLPTMTLLRCLYSGIRPPTWVIDRLEGALLKRFSCANGYLRLDRRLLLTMGGHAQASAGIVVAHHQAPLGYVLRELHAAERFAKDQGGRDAWSLKIIKRAGGAIGLTEKWFSDSADPSALELVEALRQMLAAEGVSRRAAYNSVEWLAELPPAPPAGNAAARATHRRLLATCLAHQFRRQKVDRELADKLATDLSAHVCAHGDDPNEQLAQMLMVAEFLARNTRSEQVARLPEASAMQEAAS